MNYSISNDSHYTKYMYYYNKVILNNKKYAYNSQVTLRYGPPTWKYKDFEVIYWFECVCINKDIYYSISELHTYEIEDLNTLPFPPDVIQFIKQDYSLFLLRHI